MTELKEGDREMLVTVKCPNCRGFTTCDIPKRRWVVTCVHCGERIKT